MSSAIKEENFKSNETTNTNFANEKSLSFKEWKFLKYSQINHNESLEKSGKCFKPRIYKKERIISKQIIRNNSNCGLTSSNLPFVARNSNNFYGQNISTDFAPHISYNKRNQNNHQNSSVESINIWKNFNALNNNLNHPSNFCNHNIWNFQSSVKSPSNYNSYSGTNRKNIDGAKNFSSSDNIFPQKNAIQKTFPNPFQCETKAKRLLYEFNKSNFIKDKKHKQKYNGDKSQTHETIPANSCKSSKPFIKVTSLPTKQGGKQFIQKPKFPEPNSELTKEEIKQQWKEYRQAIKPFKNRDFYNAKRVVQRLGKKNPSELDEKQLIRLKNAEDFMAVHKAHISAKYPKYVKTEENLSNFGEVYVLKTVPVNKANFVSKSVSNRLHNLNG